MPVKAPDFETKLDQYADLAIQIGLNLQPGQRLLIETDLAATDFARQLAAAGYRAGAREVEVIWSDNQIDLLRLQHADPEVLDEVPQWRVDGWLSAIDRGAALLNLYAPEPDLFADQDPARLARRQQADDRAYQPVTEAMLGRMATSWLIISVPTRSWANKVFPEQPAAEQVGALWQAIFAALRLDQPDPVAAWQAHIEQLVARRHYLDQKQYQALAYSGPGTDLTVGLVEGHNWQGGRAFNQYGIAFTPNLPTEEIFSMPHRERVEGTVRASKPLMLSGTLVEEFSLTFRQGRVVDFSARRGETVLRKMLETDEGASRLGEAALVPHSSPISQTGLTFYNTLFDENAACHLALGQAIKLCLANGAKLSDEAFAAAGGNDSVVHTDFMIGSGDLDVDGLTAAGVREPILRAGEWAFEVG